MEPPAAQPGAAPRPAVRHHFPGHAKETPTQDQIQKLDTWIPKGIALPPGKVDARGGEADHLRIPDLIQICRVCKGRGLPSTGMRWCQKWDVHRHGVLGQGAFRGVLLGSGNSRDSPWPLGGLRVILVTSEKQ